MSRIDTEPPRQAGGHVSYACPTCGGRIAKTCPCGRDRGDWLHAEDVIVVSIPKAARATPASMSEGEARE